MPKWTTNPETFHYQRVWGEPLATNPPLRIVDPGDVVEADENPDAYYFIPAEEEAAVEVKRPKRRTEGPETEEDPEQETQP